MPYSEPEEIIQVRKLFNEAKFEAASRILEKFREKENLSLHELILYYLFKSRIAANHYNNEDCIRYANKAYKKSDTLEDSLLLLDCKLTMILALFRQGKTIEANKLIKNVENLIISLHEFPTELIERKAHLATFKGWIYNGMGDMEKALKFAKRGLSLLEELNLKLPVAYSLSQIGGLYWRIGDFKLAMEYFESCRVLAEELNYKHLIQRCNFMLGTIYAEKGELDLALNYTKEALEFEQKENSPHFLRAQCIILNSRGIIYQQKGEFDKALESMKDGLEISKKLGLLELTFSVSDSLFHLSLDMKNLEQAHKYLKQMQQISDVLEVPYICLWYRLDKAVYLKHSLRALNRGKAEEMLKNLIGEINDYQMLVIALINLCDLLLSELRSTGEPEILEELQSYISQLFEAVKKSRSYSLLAETYLLQARLALINLDLKKSRQLLSKAQEIAEKYGMDQIAIKISNQHDEFLIQLEKWEKLKSSETSLSERIDLSGVDEQLDSMVHKRTSKPGEVEAEQPILLIIISEKGKPILINRFATDITINDKSLGEFISSYSNYCDEIFSKTFDRVKLGQYTVLISAGNGFSTCYLFLGKTYSAHQKVKFFSEVLLKDNQVMEILKHSLSEEKMIDISDHPHFEDLITKSFTSDPSLFRMPFKAYKGDEPFVFASYAHADKLEVYPIIDYLNKKNIKIWYDEGIPISENWKRTIATNLERATTFLVFVTPQIINSKYVRKEISFALKKQKPFFAVYLKETMLPTELEFEIADIQAMMSHLMPKSEFYAKLKEMLSNSLNN
ncbi:MAG: TIR domain-containing protein [Candidatus Hermodarchaeota archaeon]